jgi:carbamate kinase
MAIRVVTCLGGNAFVPPGGHLTMEGQFEFAQVALRQLIPLLNPEYQLLIGHGNGPQVGHMLIRVEHALGAAYHLPLEVCVAESEGELGYVIQQTMYNLLRELRIERNVVGLITQVQVDPNDPAFDEPTKPIGPFLEEAEAKNLEKEGLMVKEESGRGWRRVVPSPRPLAVIEANVVEALLSLGVVVIAAGGGGIPVVRENDQLKGVEAVIDKDFTAALLADLVNAELLVILTGVPNAFVDYNKPTQRALPRATPAEVRRLLAEGQFPPGSMAPKMEAAAIFAESKRGRRSIVCDPSTLEAALAGRAGTIVEQT